jgi:hypothetical protein
MSRDFFLSPDISPSPVRAWEKVAQRRMRPERKSEGVADKTRAQPFTRPSGGKADFGLSTKGG